ncbi:MAG: hypothetical protein RLZZ511_1218 [Cyanobacteriota bacterium]|jgi:hypothetical protein
MSFELYYDQASLRYELERLLQDLAELKGTELSRKETLYLCAALIGKELQEVAAYLHIATQSAQVFVSDTIKIYIKGLLESHALVSHAIVPVTSRLSWHRVPYVCQSLGYARSPELSVEGPKNLTATGNYLLQQVSETPSQFDVAQLILEMSVKRDRILFQGEHPLVAESLAAITCDRINQILAPVLDLDEISGPRQAAYLEVIKLRWGLVQQDPMTYLDQAVKMVQDLNMIKCYVDAVPLALELVPLVPQQPQKAQLQECMARAAEAIAKQTWDDRRRQEAILCYQNAIDRGDYQHCAPLFNIFWLNFEFAQHFAESPKYRSDARHSLRYFVNVANQPDYNFAAYRSAIQKEVRSMQQQTQDPILLGYLAQVVAWS